MTDLYRHHILPLPFFLSALPSSTIICAFYTVCGQFVSPSPLLSALSLFAQTKPALSAVMLRCEDKLWVSVSWNALKTSLVRQCVNVQVCAQSWSQAPSGSVTHLMSHYRKTHKASW